MLTCSPYVRLNTHNTHKKLHLQGNILNLSYCACTKNSSNVTSVCTKSRLKSVHLCIHLSVPSENPQSSRNHAGVLWNIRTATCVCFKCVQFILSRSHLTCQECQESKVQYPTNSLEISFFFAVDCEINEFPSTLINVQRDGQVFFVLF